jgi:hypothetical protein
MPKKTNIDQCVDPTQELTLKIPCIMAERIEAYATEMGTDIDGVVIEALDMFLRNPNNRS